ncbi:septum site-determining protein MinC [Leeia sp. TBRC 13508]|uniref:Probable septum site-determining protein MinC n=1 Tax=Leeia speluncae TaxID=2884804 RepID=A0ABS8D698_9NEIS|nr:septum site-determining protein MinC [Leeia speluncae]MCB6183728.1 septum site-determining protein MinC [Leeia speluncae]
MTSTPAGHVPAIFDLKSATLTLIAVVLKTTNLDELATELNDRLSKTPNFFSQDPVVIDFSLVMDQPTPDFARLIPLLKQFKMIPIAAKGGNDQQMNAALAAGLTEAPEQHAPATVAAPRVETVVKEVIKEVVREVSVPTAGVTMVIDRPLRSGQQVYAKGGDLVVLGAVSFGAEVIADGSIHVYAPLRGKAIAGARGNMEARIFTTQFEPELISIAGIYRTTDTPLPANVAGKAAHIRLEGEKMIMEPLVF